MYMYIHVFDIACFFLPSFSSLIKTCTCTWASSCVVLSLLQWRSVPKTELMDSKLKCSFIEQQGSDQADKPTEAAEQQPAAASVRHTVPTVYIHLTHSTHCIYTPDTQYPLYIYT